MEAEGEKKGATSAEKKGEMVEEQGDKGATVSEADKGKMAEEPGEKKGETAADKGKAVVLEEQGNKGVAASEAEKGVAEAKEKGFITVLTSDGEIRHMSEAAAQLSWLLRGMVEDGCTNNVILLLKVDASTLAPVLEYCNKHVKHHVEDASKPDSDTAGSTSAGVSASAAASEDLEAWDRTFVDRLTMDDLQDVLLAAHYLEIKGLLDIAAHKAADMIKGKTTEEIRDAFNLTDDFAAEKKAELREKYVWNFNA